jgi:hypothetical protein
VTRAACSPPPRRRTTSASCHVGFTPSRLRATSALRHLAFVPRRLCAISSRDLGFRATSALRHLGFVRGRLWAISASRDLGFASRRFAPSRFAPFGVAPLVFAPLVFAPPRPRPPPAASAGARATTAAPSRPTQAAVHSRQRCLREQRSAHAALPPPSEQRPCPRETTAVANSGRREPRARRELRPPRTATAGPSEQRHTRGRRLRLPPGRLRLLGEQPRAAAPRVWPPISRRPGPTPRAFSTSQRGGKIAIPRPAISHPHWGNRILRYPRARVPSAGGRHPSLTRP